MPRLTSDAETTANLTNLAIKGIIGVKAMAEISRAVGQETVGTQYDVRPKLCFFRVWTTWLIGWGT